MLSSYDHIVSGLKLKYEKLFDIRMLVHGYNSFFIYCLCNGFLTSLHAMEEINVACENLMEDFVSI